MTNEAPTRRYAKGDAKRREILEAALTVISERGYRNSSLQEIADAVGLTKAGVLHYFESREHLLAEVLRERDEATTGSTPSDLDLIDTLGAAISHNQTVPGLVQLYSRLVVESEATEHAGHEYIRGRYDDIARLLTEALAERQAAGTLRPDFDPATLAHVLTAVSDGLQLQWLHDPSLDMRRGFDAVLALMEPVDGA